MINITQGNDATLYANFKRGGAVYEFDTITTVNLITTLGKTIALSYSYNGGTVAMTVPATLSAGTYALEIAGTKDSTAQRTAAQKVLTISKYTEQGDYDNADNADTHDIVMYVSLAHPTPRKADAPFTITITDALIRAAAVSWQRPLTIVPVIGSTNTIAECTAAELTYGKYYDTLAAQPVAWADIYIAEAAAAVDNSPKTYGDLMSLPQADFDEWIAAMSNYTNDSGQKPFLLARQFPELQLVTQIATLGGFTSSRFAYLNFPESITTVAASAFYGCSSLVSVSLPNATSIGSYAFYGCTSLVSVSLPNATSIGNNAFQGCSALVTVSLPNATSIGNNAFLNCSSLVSVSLPNATSIGNNAFQGCTSLVTVSLPNATSIGNDAFYSCRKLTTLILGATPPAATGSLSTSCTVYVPDTAVSTYQEATAWKSYTIKPWSDLPDELKVEE